ncbi:MAG: CdaR family protein [Lachnospiraceae bacterium]
MKKILKRLTNNLGLKLLSALFAVILWLVVVNIDDPQRTTKFTIPITIENENYLTELGKYYKVVDEVNTVTISVTAKRTIVEKLSASDFKAVVNMENIEAYHQVKIEVTPLRFSNQLTVTQKSDYLQVKVGELATKRFVVAAKIIGTPAKEAAVGEVKLSRNLLKVSGPQEVVENIDSAAVTINVDGFSSDVTDEMIPELYDADGKKIDTTEITMNIQTIQVTVSMMEVKTVPLRFQVSGTPPEGYQYVTTRFTPESVKVKGSPTVLNTINAIEIPGEVLDLTGATENIQKTVDITTYLPDGIELVDSEDGKITVVAVIDENETRTLSVPTENLTVQNLPENYEVRFAADKVKISVTGFASVLDGVDANAITGTVDVAGLEPGSHSVPIMITADGDYTVASASVVVYLKQKGQEENSMQKPSTDTGQEVSDEKKDTTPSKVDENDEKNNDKTQKEEVEETDADKDTKQEESKANRKNTWVR